MKGMVRITSRLKSLCKKHALLGRPTAVAFGRHLSQRYA